MSEPPQNWENVPSNTNRPTATINRYSSMVVSAPPMMLAPEHSVVVAVEIDPRVARALLLLIEATVAVGVVPGRAGDPAPIGADHGALARGGLAIRMAGIVAAVVDDVEPPAVEYLEPEHVRVLLDRPDQRNPIRLRDYTLGPFLYNTGARISQTLGVLPDVRGEHEGEQRGVRAHGGRR